jgi:hypothetical protein
VVLASNVLEHFDPTSAASVVATSPLLKPAAASSSSSRTSATRGGATSTTTRIAPSSPTCRCRPAARARLPDRSRPAALSALFDARRTHADPPWIVRAYLRSPIKPMAGRCSSSRTKTDADVELADRQHRPARLQRRKYIRPRSRTSFASASSTK